MATRASLDVGIIGSTAKAVIWVALATLALAAFGGYAFAQEPAAAANDKVLSKAELNALVGKIALYPDDLVALVLPASTYPLQVVEAERFLEGRKRDSSLKPSDKWDDSVVALLNYPEVVKLMNDDLDWTWKLGDAVINQRGEVLDAIQDFRGQAASAGNLHTDEHEVVQNDDQGGISIKPADPQVVYVPYYDPQQVVVEQPTPVYYYYPYGYPLYYYPYPYGYPFAAGYFWGVTTAFVIGWHNHYVHVVHCGYPGHPYYGHTYYGGYYVHHDVGAVSHGSYVWEPHYRAGGQPFTRSDGRQLAIAHHDPNAGGAPSGYHRADHGPPSSVGYRGGSPSNGHGSDSHGDYGHGNYGSGGSGNADGHGHYGNGHGNNGNGDTGHGNYGPGHGGDGSGNGDGHGSYGNGHASPGFGPGVVPNGVRSGMKQIQPIRNDPPTQAAIRSELRERAPNQAAFNPPSAGGAHVAPATPGAVNRYTYQAPNPSLSFRSPTNAAVHGAPQYNAPQVRSVPQLNAPQVHGTPQVAPQFHGVPQQSMPQMRTMPMPSAPATSPRAAVPHEGGASYVYRSPSFGGSMPQANMARPSMPQASAGHASAHQGGESRGSQGHGWGGRGAR